MEWNEILKRRDYSREEPDKLVIQFTESLKNKHAKRVLDLGCGAGRHLIYLTKQGFETYGIDISETGLKQAKNRLKREKLNAALIKCDMKTLPYVSHCFDAVISLFTIYHNTKQGIKDTITETHRTLRKKGTILLNFQSKRSSKHGKGTKIEENTFIQENGPEKGIIHHFVDENEIHELLKGFKISKIQLEERRIGGYLQSRWTVSATKD
jgi:cyclopropane fatty-acyl-phospholipid synthase-like methyltransferase